MYDTTGLTAERLQAEVPGVQLRSGTRDAHSFARGRLAVSVTRSRARAGWPSTSDACALNAPPTELRRPAGGREDGGGGWPGGEGRDISLAALRRRDPTSAASWTWPARSPCTPSVTGPATEVVRAGGRGRGRLGAGRAGTTVPHGPSVRRPRPPVPGPLPWR